MEPLAGGNTQLFAFAATSVAIKSSSYVRQTNYRQHVLIAAAGCCTRSRTIIRIYMFSYTPQDERRLIVNGDIYYRYLMYERSAKTQMDT